MKTYPIGLTIIGATAIVLMVLAPKHILLIMAGVAVATFAFTCYVIGKDGAE